MSPRTIGLVLALATVLGCGGARKESREGAPADARGERRSESARDERRAGGERGQEGAPRSGRAERQEERASAGKEPRVAASPQALLGRDTVANVQQALAGRGLLREHRQGELDTPTRAAVRRFQEQRGLAATGVPDKETLRELGVSADEAYGTGRGGGKG